MAAKRVMQKVKDEERTYSARWRHPGGKMLELGAEKLSDTELLSILIGVGIKGKSAEQIAEEMIERFGSFKGLANQPMEKLQKLKGLGPVKIVRIATAFEIARRIVKQTKSSV